MDSDVFRNIFKNIAFGDNFLLSLSLSLPTRRSFLSKLHSRCQVSLFTLVPAAYLKKKKKEAYPATFYTRTTNRPSSNNKIARRIFNRSVFPINSRIRVGIKPIPIETGRPALKRTVS